MADDYRQRIATALSTRIKQATLPQGPVMPWEVKVFGATEYDLADAVLAVRDDELARLRAAAEHCFISAHDGMQAELDTAIATLTRMHDDPEMRAKLLELRIGLEGEAFVAVRRADLDLVMNGAGDATRTADYPAACQRIRDALGGGRHG